MSGSVRYVAVGAPAEAEETPGQAAARALREQLDLEADIVDLVFADIELGVEHFFFLAAPSNEGSTPWDTEQHTVDGTSVAALKRSTPLGYPIRPAGIARRLHRARRG